MQHPELYYVLTKCSFTRKEIAKRIGINISTLHNWEYGRTRFNGYMLVQVCIAAEFPAYRIPKKVRQLARRRAVDSSEELYSANYDREVEAREARRNSPEAKASALKAAATRAKFKDLNRLEDLTKGLI